mmetsp:Transcript_57297/g.168233  ORF Transcript_57297/g.168233 Transcript_57297/m.168233 type:complete len:456 (+) Transcript_57297:276-1643(+)
MHRSLRQLAESSGNDKDALELLGVNVEIVKVPLCELGEVQRADVGAVDLLPHELHARLAQGKPAVDDEPLPQHGLELQVVHDSGVVEVVLVEDQLHLLQRGRGDAIRLGQLAQALLCLPPDGVGLQDGPLLLRGVPRDEAADVQVAQPVVLLDLATQRESLPGALDTLLVEVRKVVHGGERLAEAVAVEQVAVRPAAGVVQVSQDPLHLLSLDGVLAREPAHQGQAVELRGDVKARAALEVLRDAGPPHHVPLQLHGAAVDGPALGAAPPAVDGVGPPVAVGGHRRSGDRGGPAVLPCRRPRARLRGRQGQGGAHLGGPPAGRRRRLDGRLRRRRRRLGGGPAALGRRGLAVRGVRRRAPEAASSPAGARRVPGGAAGPAGLAGARLSRGPRFLLARVRQVQEAPDLVAQVWSDLPRRGAGRVREAHAPGAGLHAGAREPGARELRAVRGVPPKD